MRVFLRCDFKVASQMFSDGRLVAFLLVWLQR